MLTTLKRTATNDKKKVQSLYFNTNTNEMHEDTNSYWKSKGWKCPTENDDDFFRTAALRTVSLEGGTNKYPEPWSSTYSKEIEKRAAMTEKNEYDSSKYEDGNENGMYVTHQRF
mmetsp:Transcript_17782/g.17864  ORF Transcript_17782/g.17864 Transcript_17782/m.17864 type:complete len:114 (-) Transcript_17782:402-743(-)